MKILIFVCILLINTAVFGLSYETSLRKKRPESLVENFYNNKWNKLPKKRYDCYKLTGLSGEKSIWDYEHNHMLACIPYNILQYLQHRKRYF